jgi:hypothetical protein
MDESGEDGVIFVSFGSVLKAATMSEDQKNALSKSFSERFGVLLSTIR